MVFSILGITTAAVNNGTAEVNIISTAEDFLAISDNPNGQYFLANDISLEGVDVSQLGNTYFGGILDGNGFSITGLQINHANRYSAGLFDSVEGTVKNLVIKDARIDLHMNVSDAQERLDVGILGGNCIGATIEQVEIHGTIQLLGNYNSSVSIGGLFGYARNAKLDHVSVNVDILSTVSGTSADIGGVTGIYLGDGINVTNSLYRGKIEAHISRIWENAHIGGLISSSPANIIADNCMVKADIDVDAGSSELTVTGISRAQNSKAEISINVLIDDAIAWIYGGGSPDSGIQTDNITVLGSINVKKSKGKTSSGVEVVAAGLANTSNGKNFANVDLITEAAGYGNRYCCDAYGLLSCVNSVNFGTVSGAAALGWSVSLYGVCSSERSVNDAEICVVNDGGEAYAYGLSHCTDSRNACNIRANGSGTHTYARGVYIGTNCINEGNIDATGNGEQVYAVGANGTYVINYGTVTASGNASEYSMAIGSSGNGVKNYGYVSAINTYLYGTAEVFGVGGGGQKCTNSVNYADVYAWGDGGHVNAYGVYGDNSANQGFVEAVTSNGYVTAYGVSGNNNTGTGSVKVVIHTLSNYIHRAQGGPTVTMIIAGESYTATQGTSSSLSYSRTWKTLWTAENISMLDLAQRKEGNFVRCAEVSAVSEYGGMLPDIPAQPAVPTTGSNRVDFDESIVGKVDEETGEKDTFVIQLQDFFTGEVILNADVTLDDQSCNVGEMGIAKFLIPEKSSVTLIAEAEGYIYCQIDSYFEYNTKNCDIVMMYPDSYKDIIPLSCNGTDISKDYAQINVKADLEADIYITCSPNLAAEYFELKQGNTLLGSCKDGKFRIENERFNANEPVTAYMYLMGEEEPVTKDLNISVVSFGFQPNPAEPLEQKLDLSNEWDLFKGLDLTIGFGEKWNIKYSVTNTRLKVGLNLKGTVWESPENPDSDTSDSSSADSTNTNKAVVEKPFKEFLNEIKNEYEKLKEKNKEKDKDKEEENDKENDEDKNPSTKKLSVGVGGYLVAEIGNEGIAQTYGEMLLFTRFSTEWGTGILFGSVPIRIEVEFNIDGMFEITNIGYDFENATWLIPSAGFKFKGDVTGRVGVGVKALSAGVYGKLGATLDMDYTTILKVIPSLTPQKLSWEGSMGFYAKADIKVWKGDFEYAILKGEGVLWEKSHSTGNTVSSTSQPETLYSPEYYTLDRKSGAAADTAWNSETDNGVLATGIYDSADPQIVRAGDTVLMVYLSDSGDIDDINYQQLVYSLWDGSGWSKPVPVDNNPRIDAEFVLHTDEEEIWLVYTEANRLLTEDEESEDCVGAMEIAAVRFDPVRQCFEEPVVLTSDNLYDCHPVISIIRGVPTVAWVQNLDNHLFGMTGNNTVYFSQWDGEAWSAPQIFAENIAAVKDLAVGTFDGRTAYVAVLCDADNDFITTDDSVITIYEADGSCYTHQETAAESLLTFARELYWYQNGAIYMLSAAESTPEVILDSLSANTAADFRIVYAGGTDNILMRVYNTEGENGGSDLYISRYMHTGWTTPVRLTETEGYVDSFAATEWDNMLLLTYRKTDVTFTEESFEIKSDLCTSLRPFNVSLEISDISYEIADFSDDECIELMVSVTNNGTEPTEIVQCYIGNTSIQCNIVVNPGETKEYPFLYIIDPAEPVSKVTVIDANDVSVSQNVRLAYADFVVNAQSFLQQDTSILMLIVQNEGNANGKGTLCLRNGDANGEIFYIEKVELAPDEQKILQIAIQDDSLEEVYIEIVSDEEDYYEGDNHTSCTVCRKVVAGDVNGDGEISSEDTDILKKYFAGYQLDTAEEYRFSNMDVNQDGEVTRRDAMILARHLAGWEGYEVLPYEG